MTRFAHRLFLVLLLALGVVAPGCRTVDETGAGSFELDRFLDRQADRASLLRVLESSGTIEIRRKQEGETSFDDCALELWRDGDRFALRLRKLGERFLWVGSDGAQWWLFELAADPVRLVILPPGQVGRQAIAPDLLLFGPDQLLNLAGLEPILADPADIEPTIVDGKGRIAFPASHPDDSWSTVVWWIDLETLLPERIEILDGEGRLTLESVPGGYEPIRARDQPVGNWPDFPRRLRVRDAEGSTDVKIFFNQPGATGARNRDRLFDIEALMKSFKPGTIEYVN